MSLFRFFRSKSITGTAGSRQATSFITQEVEGKPRAVVLVLGFAGSKPRHVAKYANIYNLNKCTTVAGTASNYDVFAFDKAGQDSVAMDAVRNVSKVLHSIQSDNDKKEVPVVMHIMSNGGAYVTARLSLMLEAAAKDKPKEGGNADGTEDLRLFAERLRLGYQIFDSAPGYMNVKSGYNVIRDLIPNKFIAIPAAVAFTTISYLRKVALDAIGKQSDGEEFWNLLLDDRSCMRQAYIYSQGDKVCDSVKIEEMAMQRKDRGVHVMTKHFEDSKHVQHLRLHETEYVEFVTAVLQDMEARNNE
eukprot:scaffold5966_cov118-Cylindrotheca_fusiformis.AAC.1